MNEKRMLRLLSQVDEAYILEASPCRSQRTGLQRRRTIRRAVVIAAAILLLAITTALAIGVRFDFAAWISGALPDPEPAYIQEQLEEGQWVSLNGGQVAVIVPESPVRLLLSSDGGETWRETVITESRDMFFLGAYQEDMQYQGGYVGFNGQDGYLVLTSGISMNHQALRIFLTADGGETWREIGTPYDQHISVITGAGFASQEVGFISYRYFEDAGPDIWRTTDGGETWSRLEIELPEEYQGGHFTPLSPSFDGLNGVYPIEMLAGDETERIICLYSRDGGLTWSFSPDQAAE